jgi:hypothetical protein
MVQEKGCDPDQRRQGVRGDRRWQPHRLPQSAIAETAERIVQEMPELVDIIGKDSPNTIGFEGQRQGFVNLFYLLVPVSPERP